MAHQIRVPLIMWKLFADPPGGSTIEGNSSVIEGSEITLACIADYLGDPEGKFYWNSPSGATRVGRTLLIRNATVDSDDGEYQCFVENFAKGEFGNHTLTVNGTFSVVTVCVAQLKHAFPNSCSSS